MELNEAIIVAGGSFFADEPTELLRIDPATGNVVARYPLVRPSVRFRDGALWTLGPMGLVPGPQTSTLSRVDLATNTVTTIGEIPFAVGFDVGLGAIWVFRDDRLDKLDPNSGSLLASWPWPADLRSSHDEHPYAAVACDALWITVFRGPAGGGSTTFAQIDPQTGRRLGTWSFPVWAIGLLHDAASGCWTAMFRSSPALGSWLVRFEAVRGPVERSPVLPTRIAIIGDTFWSWTGLGVVQQIDPHTGAPLGDASQLPNELREGTWETWENLRLAVADGSLWVVTSGTQIQPESALWRLDVPARE